jgi:ATP-dependent DNA helicase RecQ
MASHYPSNEEEFAQISGVGEQKLKRFGKIFISEIAAYLGANQTKPRR